jgi:hypothetical protein
MNFQNIVSLLVGASFVTSCQDAEKKVETGSTEAFTEGERQQFSGKGKEAVGDLAGTLGSQLKAAMASGGPVAAVKVCKEVAQPLTNSTGAKRDGVTIGRTALKVRNPQNAPDDIDREVLEAWEALKGKGDALPGHELVRLDDDTVRFYKPIILQEVCLNCHGSDEQFLPELKKTLDELYPGDQARGFQVGDLRGVFRVEMEVSSAE